MYIFRGWLFVYRFLWLLPNYTRKIRVSGLDFPVGSRATIFRFQPLFSIKRPSNATGSVLFVMISVVSVHLQWWFGLSLWFLLSCPPAGRSPLLRFSRSHMFFYPSSVLSVLLPSYCSSSSLSLLPSYCSSSTRKHLVACQVILVIMCACGG